MPVSTLLSGRCSLDKIIFIVEEGFAALFRHSDPPTAEQMEFEVADELLVPPFVIRRDFPDLRHVDDSQPEGLAVALVWGAGHGNEIEPPEVVISRVDYILSHHILIAFLRLFD